MTSSNTIAFGADTLDVDSVKVPGTMLVVRRALLAYEKKMQPGDHLVVCAEEVGKKGRNRVEVAVIHERADAVAAKAAIDRGDDVSAKIQRVAVPPKELVSMCAEIESAEVPQLEGEAEPAGELGTAAEDAPAPVVEAEPVVIELSPEEKRLNEVAAALGDAAHLAECVVIALGKRSLGNIKHIRLRTLENIVGEELDPIDRRALATVGITEGEREAPKGAGGDGHVAVELAPRTSSMRIEGIEGAHLRGDAEIGVGFPRAEDSGFVTSAGGGAAGRPEADVGPGLIASLVPRQLSPTHEAPRTISAEWPKANKRHRLPTQ